MRPPRIPRRLLLAFLLTILTFPLGGFAYAYWGGSGTGTGTGTTGTTVAVTLTPGTPTADLYPQASTDVELSVTNTNLLPVFIGSLALDTTQGTSGYAVDGAHSGCDVATLGFTTATNGGAGWTVPAKVEAVDGTLAITLTTPLSMGVGAANACQGATLTIYLAAGP